MSTYWLRFVRSVSVNAGFIKNLLTFTPQLLIIIVMLQPQSYFSRRFRTKCIMLYTAKQQQN